MDLKPGEVTENVSGSAEESDNQKQPLDELTVLLLYIETFAPAMGSVVMRDNTTPYTLVPGCPGPMVHPMHKQAQVQSKARAVSRFICAATQSRS